MIAFLTGEKVETNQSSTYVINIIFFGSCPPVHLIKDLVSSVDRVTFYGFLISLAKHEDVNTIIGKWRDFVQKEFLAAYHWSLRFTKPPFENYHVDNKFYYIIINLFILYFLCMFLIWQPVYLTSLPLWKRQIRNSTGNYFITGSEHVIDIICCSSK